MAGFSAYYLFNDYVSIGTDISCEYHNFPDFHSYHDLKADVGFRSILLPLNEKETIRLNYSFKVGADFVFRDDKDFGCYPLIVIAGFDFSFKLNDRSSIKTGVDFAQTYQKGSDVFHITPYASYTYRYSKDSK